MPSLVPMTPIPASMEAETENFLVVVRESEESRWVVRRTREEVERGFVVVGIVREENVVESDIVGSWER